MRVVSGGIDSRLSSRRDGVGCHRVGLLLTVILIAWQLVQLHHRTVDTLPVIHVLTLAPLTFESLLTLTDGLWVVEVPDGRLLVGVRCGCWTTGREVTASPITDGLLCFGFLAGQPFFLLLLL